MIRCVSSKWRWTLSADRNAAPLPAGARRRLHRQEQPDQAALPSPTRPADFLQMQRRVGPPEPAHLSGAHGPGNRYSSLPESVKFKFFCEK